MGSSAARCRHSCACLIWCNVPPLLLLRARTLCTLRRHCRRPMRWTRRCVQWLPGCQSNHIIPFYLFFIFSLVTNHLSTLPSNHINITPLYTPTSLVTTTRCHLPKQPHNSNTALLFYIWCQAHDLGYVACVIPAPMGAGCETCLRFRIEIKVPPSVQNIALPSL